MMNLENMLKSEDFTLLIKFRIVKTWSSPVVTCGHEISTIKKAGCRRIDAFELWYWRRLLKVP